MLMWYKWDLDHFWGNSLECMALLFSFLFLNRKWTDGWISNRILNCELTWGMEAMPSRSSRKKKPDPLHWGAHTSPGLTPSRLQGRNKLLIRAIVILEFSVPNLFIHKGQLCYCFSPWQFILGYQETLIKYNHL